MTHGRTEPAQSAELIEALSDVRVGTAMGMTPHRVERIVRDADYALRRLEEGDVDNALAALRRGFQRAPVRPRAEPAQSAEPTTPAGRAIYDMGPAFVGGMTYTQLGEHLAAIEHAAGERALPKYSGLIYYARRAEEQGWSLHVATRSTCAEHIAAGDDKATEFPFGVQDRLAAIEPWRERLQNLVDAVGWDDQDDALAAARRLLAQSENTEA